MKVASTSLFGLGLCLACVPSSAGETAFASRSNPTKVSASELREVLKQYRHAMLSMAACGIETIPYETFYANFQNEHAAAYGLSSIDIAAIEAETKNAFGAQTGWQRDRVDCEAASTVHAILRETMELPRTAAGSVASLKGWTIQGTIPPEGMPAVRWFLVKDANGRWTYTREARVTQEHVERIAVNPYTRTIWLDARKSASSDYRNICWYGLLSDFGAAGNDRKKVGLTVCNSDFTTSNTVPDDFISQGLLMRLAFGFKQRQMGTENLMELLVRAGFPGVGISKPYAPISYVPMTFVPQLAMGTFMRTMSVDTIALRSALDESGLIAELEDSVRRYKPDASWGSVDTKYRIKLPDPRDIRPKD